MIVLIHGLMRSKRSMKRLAQFLNKRGFATYAYDYPSTKYTIKVHAAHLQDFIEKWLAANPNDNLQFITHSLGGIITREALDNLSPENLGRCDSLIMLAPPNHGSALAKLCLTLLPSITSFIKPLAELSSDPNAYVHHVATPKRVKISVIAGRFDAKTPPSTAYLNGQNDFTIINTTHTFIMNHPRTRKAILNFLQIGSF